MHCPFCNIDKERTRILATTQHCHVIFSNPRLMPGHLLIIPKRHVEKISELNNQEQQDILSTTIIYQEKILKHIAKGCDIRQNYRPFLEQSRYKVNHLHIHLQPREFNDNLHLKCQVKETEVFTDLSEDEIDELIGKLEMKF